LDSDFSERSSNHITR